MSVAGISSSSYLDFNAQSVHNRMQQSRQDFQQLGKDLQSGDLSAAQSDLTALESLRPQSSATSSSSATQTAHPVAQDFQQLSQDLQGGNATAAQQDYSKIQQDFQSQVQAKESQASQMQGTHHHRHHGGGGGGGSQVTQLLDQLGQSLQSGDLSSAQQAYSTLIQDLQQFGSANATTQSSTSSNGVSVSA